MRILLAVRQPVGAGEKQRSLLLEGHQVERRNVSAGLPIDQEIAARCEAVEVRREPILPNAVVDNAYPSAFGDSLLPSSVVPRGSDDRLCARSFHEFSFLRV